MNQQYIGNAFCFLTNSYESAKNIGKLIPEKIAHS